MAGFQNLDEMICRVLIGSASKPDLPCWRDVSNLDTIKTELFALVLDRVEILSGARDGTNDEPLIVQEELLALWKEESIDFFDRLCELCELFGIEVSAEVEKDLFQGWTILHAAGMLIPMIKYTVNVAFNRHIRETVMPEKPKIDIGLRLLPKSLRVALGRLRSDEKYRKRNSLYLVNSLFQGWKKGLLPFDIPVFAKTMEKHRSDLCETPGDVPEDVLDDVYRISEDLLRKFRFRPYERETKLPSTSATIEFNRCAGGSFRALLHSWYGVGYKGNSYSLAMAFDRNCRTFLGYCRDKDAVKQVFGHGPTMAELKEIELSQVLNSLFDPYEVLPYGVLEPLKIRTITRPTYRTHWGLRGVQSQLLSYLNRFDTFGITGDSNKDHLAAHIQPVITDVKKFLVSGDYSRATDTLKGAVTQCIWEVIGCKGLPWWAYVKGLKSLCGTIIRYDDDCMPKISDASPYRWYERKGDKTPGKQKTGQLMGNILSFPLLCIANYCAYHMALERTYGVHFRVSEVMANHPVRINGDDILFRADPDLYDRWVSSVSSIGFNLSLGKNFVNTEFCQINSQLFRVRYDLFGVPCGSDRIHYFNFGQLTGRKKGMDSDEARVDYSNSKFHSADYHANVGYNRALELSSVRKNFLEMRESAPKRLQSTVVDLQRRWFYRRFKAVITKEQAATTALPVEEGGLDFFPPFYKSGYVYSAEKKYNSHDVCREFFRIANRDEASELYPAMYALSKLTPTFELVSVKPKYPLEQEICPNEKKDWCSDHIGTRLFPLAL